MPLPSLSLPRLLYLSDVPVEASYHGSALLYRLLQDYPTKRLLIVERWPALSKVERRLAGVEYRRLPSGLTRLLPTRFNKVYVQVYLNLTWLDARMLWQSVRAFCPEAILTVHHGYSWASAADLARQRALPLHFIMHDVDGVGLDEGSQRRSEAVYRQATRRYCVSPAMVETYERCYGKPGTLLYPGRAKDAPIYPEPPGRLSQPIRRPTVAYGGNFFRQGFAQALREISFALETFGGRLLLFGPYHAEAVVRWGLNRPNVEFRGLVSSAEMIQSFRDEADCIFIPMPFAESDRANMEVSFPSKLTDSTIPGLPLLVYGPPHCSAVRWARENPGVVEVVDSCGPEPLRLALQKLIGSAALRWALGRAAIAAGQKFFGFTTIRDAFFKELARLPD